MLAALPSFQEEIVKCQNGTLCVSEGGSFAFPDYGYACAHVHTHETDGGQKGGEKSSFSPEGGKLRMLTNGIASQWVCISM